MIVIAIVIVIVIAESGDGGLHAAHEALQARPQGRIQPPPPLPTLFPPDGNIRGREVHTLRGKEFLYRRRKNPISPQPA